MPGDFLKLIFLQFERQKLAREHKKKQDASTLEDIKEQIQQLESKLDELKREKHELFSTLKRVRRTIARRVKQRKAKFTFFSRF